MADQPSRFSEWELSEEHQRYYCWRTNENGETEYWWYGDSGPQVASRAQPRTVSTELQHSAGSASSPQSPQPTQPNYMYTAGSSPQNVPYRISYSQTPQTHSSHSPAYHSHPSYNQTPNQQLGQYQTYSGQASYSTGSYPSHSGQAPYGTGSYPSHSGQASYGAGSYGSQPYTQPTFGATGHSGSSPPEKSTAASPRQAKRKRHLENDRNAVDAEVLDSKYKKISAKDQESFFSRGRVFATLWTEPSGPPNPERTAQSSYSKVRFNETVFTEIRRFVVVRNKGKFSKCIPIQTYGGRGTLKPGIIREDHAMIYCGNTDDDKPALIDGENLTKTALRVTPSGDASLEAASRVNFGKTYTVEHNVKVWRIGKVVKEHTVLLKHYLREADDSD